MLATMLMLGLIGASALVAAFVQFRRDGLRRLPTMPR
ncbi:Rax2 family protein [Agromyces lapidis]|uniref:Rax2 family protein n=1 Tax=Agromyces lapidis TaxID=279574 RepID=A0ABV5SK26_9MICO|nr:Rax2 family protein [Agromyces lapidis]